MNKICKNCDTRLRLGMCNGKDGDFKYCYRKCGSLEGTKESIRQFNNINELYDHDKGGLGEYLENSLEMKPYGEHINILLGRFKYDYDTTKDKYPLGFIIVE